MTISSGVYEIAPSGGDYTSLSGFEADIDAGGLTGILTAQYSERFDDVISGTSGMNFSGWTADATNHLIIQGAAAGKHLGRENSGARIIGVVNSSFALFNFSTDTCFIIIRDIEIVVENTSGGSYIGRHSTATQNDDTQFFKLHRVVGYNDRDGNVHSNNITRQWGPSVGGWSHFTDVEFINCHFRGIEALGDSVDPNFLKMYHCTILRGDLDVDNSNSAAYYCDVRNCDAYFHGPTGSYADFLSLGSNSVTNVSSDTSGTTGLQNVDPYQQLSHLQFPYNFKPRVGSLLLGAGTPITGVTTDILGNSRSLSAPSIGAFESADTTAIIPIKPPGFSAFRKPRHGTYVYGGPLAREMAYGWEFTDPDPYRYYPVKPPVIRHTGSLGGPSFYRTLIPDDMSPPDVERGPEGQYLAFNRGSDLNQGLNTIAGPNSYAINEWWGTWQPFSVAIRVRDVSYRAQGSSLNTFITASQRGVGWAIAFWNDNIIEFSVGSTAFSKVTGVSVTGDEWITWVMTYTGTNSGTAIGYKNGVQITSFTGSAPGTPGSSNRFWVGSDGTARQLNGLMAYARVWYRPLTPGEVMRLHTHPYEMLVPKRSLYMPVAPAVAAGGKARLVGGMLTDGLLVR